MTEETNPNPNLSPDNIQEPHNLISRIRRWAAPPVFPGDEDKTRRASILNTIFLAVMVVSIFLGFSLPLNPPSILVSLGASGLIASLAIFGLITIRRGHVYSAIYFFLSIIWLTMASLSFVLGGVSSPIFSSFVIIILVSGVLAGLRAAIITATASALYSILLLFLESNGIITAFEGESVNYFTRFVFIYIVIILIIYLFEHNLQRALGRTNAARIELEKTNEGLQEIQTYLREEVAQNTQQLERRNRYLETAAQIARDTTAIENQQELLDQVVNLLATQFGYYQVGIFLIEEDGPWATLRAASSEGGLAMIARNHRLGVGKQGIVGFVTGIGQPRITQDIDLDRIHSITPELPETRSEMALPLKGQGGDHWGIRYPGSAASRFS